MQYLPLLKMVFIIYFIIFFGFRSPILNER